MKKNLLICLLILFNGCSVTNNKNNKINEITIIKFMYLDDYTRAISPKSFWKFPKEHAKFILPYNENNFLDEIKSTIKKNDCNSFGNLCYAFIIRKNDNNNNNNRSDTIYSDISLKTWVFKANNTVECYYDEKGFYSKFLRENYPFFNDCW